MLGIALKGNQYPIMNAKIVKIRVGCPLNFTVSNLSILYSTLTSSHRINHTHQNGQSLDFLQSETCFTLISICSHASWCIPAHVQFSSSQTWNSTGNFHVFQGKWPVRNHWNHRLNQRIIEWINTDFKAINGRRQEPSS